MASISGENLSLGSGIGQLLGGLIGTLVAPGAGSGIGSSLGGLVGGGIGALIPGEDKTITQKPYNVNPYTQGAMASLANDKAAAENWLKQSMSGVNSAFGGASNILNQIGKMKDTSTYDPNAGYREYLSRIPQLQGILSGLFTQNRNDSQALQDNMKAQLLLVRPSHANLSRLVNFHEHSESKVMERSCYLLINLRVLIIFANRQP